MGNGLSPHCCFPPSSSNLVKLVFWGGTTKYLSRRQLAGEVMFQFPDRVICHADSFYIGQPVPVLSIEDELRAGQTYFVLPVDRIPTQDVLTATSLSLLSSGRKKPLLVDFGESPFDYVKDVDGRTMIKVMPEFIAKVITAEEGSQRNIGAGGEDGGGLCSTPELRKHYEELVGPKNRPWSPKLETIAEKKNRLSAAGRLSPVKLLGLEKKPRSV